MGKPTFGEPETVDAVARWFCKTFFDPLGSWGSLSEGSRDRLRQYASDALIAVDTARLHDDSDAEFDRQRDQQMVEANDD